MTKLTPHNGMILIQKLEIKDKSPGGIILPNAQKTAHNVATVLAIDSNPEAKIRVKTGDIVVFREHAGARIIHNGDLFELIHKDEILGVFE